MDKQQFKTELVRNETEFYLTVARFKKPIRIKPYPPDGSQGIILSELECRALIVQPGAESSCQCCSDTFPPPYPFIVEESLG